MTRTSLTFPLVSVRVFSRFVTRKPCVKKVVMDVDHSLPRNFSSHSILAKGPIRSLQSSDMSRLYQDIHRSSFDCIWFAPMLLHLARVVAWQPVASGNAKNSSFCLQCLPKRPYQPALIQFTVTPLTVTIVLKMPGFTARKEPTVSLIQDQDIVLTIEPGLVSNPHPHKISSLTLNYFTRSLTSSLPLSAPLEKTVQSTLPIYWSPQMPARSLRTSRPCSMRSQARPS